MIKSVGSSMKSLGSSIKSLGSSIKSLGSSIKAGVFNKKLGVFNKSLNLRWQILGLQWKAWGTWGFQWKGVYYNTNNDNNFFYKKNINIIINDVWPFLHNIWKSKKMGRKKCKNIGSLDFFVYVANIIIIFFLQSCIVLTHFTL